MARWRELLHALNAPNSIPSIRFSAGIISRPVSSGKGFLGVSRNESFAERAKCLHVH
jgi:hypothetical protein